MRKPNIKSYLCIAFILLGNASVYSQVINLTMDGKESMTCFGVKGLEFVDGVKNKAMRTDGYSSYTNASIKPTLIDSTTFSMSLWCAPETYPMMNVNEAETIPTYATIVGNIDDVDKTGFAFELSSQGDYRFRCYANGWETICKATGKMSCYAWSHLVAELIDRKLYLYNNGVQVGIANMNYPLSTGSTTLYIGKSAADLKAFGTFNINTFNGLIDEFAVYNSTLTGLQLSGTDQTPNLSIPSSRFADDIFRPQLHGMPACNWTNESHGLTWYNGKYHIFFQKNANGPYMARLHWGHLTTTDLLHWQEEKIALAPSESYDLKGCWSGSVMMVSGQPHIIYTGVDNARARIVEAIPNDINLINWTKQGVIIDGRPAGLSDDFRDPYSFELNGNRYIIVGTSKNGIGAMTLHKYVNGAWTNDGSMFFQGTNANISGTFWEMPTVTPMGNKWLVTATPLGTGNGTETLYWVGNINSDGTFTPDDTTPRQLELDGMSKQGFGLLSPSITQVNGKTILMGIVPDKLNPSNNYQMGWAHTYSLPREITLSSDGSLIQKPAIASDTNASTVILNDSLINGPVKLDAISGRQWHVTGEFVVGTSSFGFNFLKAGNQMAKLFYDPSSNEVNVDFTGIDRLVNDGGVFDGKYVSQLPTRPAGGETMKLDVFFDHSILDVFINETYAFSLRVFATNPLANDVEVFANGITKISRLTANTMTTGINSILSQPPTDHNWYTIGGIKKKSPLSPGIYIHQGRKIITP